MSLYVTLFIPCHCSLFQLHVLTMFLLYTLHICLFFHRPRGAGAGVSSWLDGGADVVEEEPPHDPVTGDYPFESKFFPKEKKLKFDSKENCSKKNPNIKLEIEEYIKKYGYFLQTRKVITEDGYFLSVFRINGSKISPPKPGKIPVFLNHGLAGTAWAWMIAPNNISLAFKLANEGFDVYISNARTNGYSEGHRDLRKDDNDYWDFSFHELGYYDVPAVIDHILNVTGKVDLYFVGHSLGALQFLVAMSMRREYNEKIRVAFLLGAAGYVRNIRSLPLRTTIMSVPASKTYALTSGHFRDLTTLSDILSGLQQFCFFACGICDVVAIQQLGYNPYQNDLINARMLGAKYLAPLSTKILSMEEFSALARESQGFLNSPGHLHQSLSQQTFAMYDYGEAENKQRYGRKTPPAYPLDKITAPIVNYWSYSDDATTPEDIKFTMSKLSPKTLKENNRVALRSFNHMDFLYANDVEKLVTNRIVWIMKKELYRLENIGIEGFF